MASRSAHLCDNKPAAVRSSSRINRIEFRRKLKPKYVRVDPSVTPQHPKYSSSHYGYEAISRATAKHGPSACGCCRKPGQSSVHMERDHEGTYRCSRIGHPRCQPDVRADGAHRQQCGELLRPGVRTKLLLLSVRLLRVPAVHRGIARKSRDNIYRVIGSRLGEGFVCSPRLKLL